jgi:hypothetical protein
MHINKGPGIQKRLTIDIVGASETPPNRGPLPQSFTDKQLVELIDKAIKSYAGSSETLAKAIGFLMIGRRFGWRVMFLIHRQSTVKNYEAILGIDSREVMPEEGPEARRSVAYNALKHVSNFWKAVKGEIPGVRSGEILRK